MLKTPNPDTEKDRVQFNNFTLDPENLTQPDHQCKEPLSSDQLDQNFPEKVDFVKLEGDSSQSIGSDSALAVQQQFNNSLTVKLEGENLINQNCSKNFSDPENSVLQEDLEHEVDQVASLQELQELEDQLEGIYHKKKGYLKFIRFEGKRIIGRKSGMKEEQTFYWSGCTGKVELKK